MSPPSHPPTSHERPMSPPEMVALAMPPGQVAAAVTQLDGIVARQLAATGVPGLALAVVHDDALVYAKGFGVRKVGEEATVDTDTVFQLASLSKPLAATLIAAVVGDGKVAWDDPVMRHLPDFVLADPYVTQHLTIEDLFAHRSGLPDHAGDLLEDLGYDRAEVLHRLRHLPLQPFRAGYAYTNFGITAAAQAVANAAGSAWEDLARDRLYRPLGMNATSSRYADYAAAPNHAALHVETDAGWVPRYTRQPDAQSPAGGVSASVNDMARWLRLLLAQGVSDGRQLVDARALARSHAPHMPTGLPSSPAARASFYGLGMNVGVDQTGRVRLSHSGAFALGAGTNIVLSPAERLGIVALTNGQPIGLAEAINAEFMDLALVGHVTFDWLAGFGAMLRPMMAGAPSALSDSPPSSPAAARQDAAYVGSYANDYYGSAEVVAGADGLLLRLGPVPLEFPLRHWDGDTFALTPTGENATRISAVTFVGGAAGTASEVRVEWLDEIGLGTFARS